MNNLLSSQGVQLFKVTYISDNIQRTTALNFEAFHTKALNYLLDRLKPESLTSADSHLHDKVSIDSLLAELIKEPFPPNGHLPAEFKKNIITIGGDAVTQLIEKYIGL